MKKIISFSLFAAILMLVLVAKRTAMAQTVSTPASQSVTVVNPPCHRGHRWVHAMPPHRRIHVKHYGMRWHARQMRRGRPE